LKIFSGVVIVLFKLLCCNASIIGLENNCGDHTGRAACCCKSHVENAD